LIDGTPVIDIKPYHYVDALPPDSLKIPEWLEQTKDKDLHEVHFCDKAKDDLKSLIDHDGLHFYKGADSLD
jgi:tRNA (Thr-GGU) A37 N-methylase